MMRDLSMPSSRRAPFRPEPLSECCATIAHRSGESVFHRRMVATALN